MGNVLCRRRSYDDTVLYVANIKNEADEGDVESQYELAEMYFSGYFYENVNDDENASSKRYIINKNHSNAVFYYEKAADQNHHMAQYKLCEIEAPIREKMRQDWIKAENEEKMERDKREHAEKIFRLVSILNIPCNEAHIIKRFTTR